MRPLFTTKLLQIMKSISVLGTSSNAGKSWMVTALGAWLRRQGINVAPFKAQNMSNNSYVTLEGGEIGRAQSVQAIACGIRPIALKISINQTLQYKNEKYFMDTLVVVNC